MSYRFLSWLGPLFVRMLHWVLVSPLDSVSLRCSTVLLPISSSVSISAAQPYWLCVGLAKPRRR